MESHVSRTVNLVRSEQCVDEFQHRESMTPIYQSNHYSVAAEPETALAFDRESVMPLPEIPAIGLLKHGPVNLFSVARADCGLYHYPSLSSNNHLLTSRSQRCARKRPSVAGNHIC